ncbi:RCC1 repeat-containing protein [bacterium]|nr:RCC1 repeat-containing protein [bacterium]
MATISFNQVLTGNGTSGGTLTVADSSGFEIGATVFLVAEGQDVKRLKIQSKPSPTTVVVVNLNDSVFNASAFTTAARATLFQPKSSLVFTSGSDTAPFYPLISNLNKTTVITAPGEEDLVLNSDVGDSLVVRKSGVEKAAIDNDGQIRHGGVIESKLSSGFSELGLSTTPAGEFDVAAGFSHSVLLKSDGTLWNWGNNTYGQLGDGTTTNSLAPIQNSLINNVKAVAAGGGFTIVLKNDGTVWGIGRNTHGQLGDGSTTNRNTFVQVSGLTDVVSIQSLGNSLYCVALKSDGTVWAWGSNNSGQLGDGTTTNRSTPVQVSGLSNIVSFNLGQYHSLFVKSDGTVWGCGLNFNNQLGDGTNTNRLTPVQISGLTGISAVAAGTMASYALKSDGTVWSWGINFNGELGDGTFGSGRSVPAQIPNLSDVVGIFSGGIYASTFAVKSDGSVWSWGRNDYGMLGYGQLPTMTGTPTKIKEPSNQKIKKIEVGGEFVLSLSNRGTVNSWGRNEFGQLGTGVTQNDVPGFPGTFDSGSKMFGRSKPGFVSGYNGAQLISGGLFHTAALRKDGTVWTWGRNNFGQLGDSTNIDKNSPIKTTLSSVSSLSAGNNHTMAVKSDGTLWAWGLNASGQLGDATNTNRNSPTQISGFSGASLVACGADHSLVLKTNGTVWASGLNDYGQLGDNTTNNSNSFQQVPDFSNATKLAVGQKHSVALKSDGTVWAWGRNNFGQLGNGSSSDSYVPVQVGGLSGVREISSSLNHTLALKSDGTVWAWGKNDYGQLGDNTKIDRSSTVQVLGISDIISVAAGDNHSLALKKDGTVWAWGFNENGQLGNNSLQDSLMPVQVSTSEYITGIFAGKYHSSAINHSGFVYSWGRNWYYELGTRTEVVGPPTSTPLDFGQPLSASKSGFSYKPVKVDLGVPCLYALVIESGATSTAPSSNFHALIVKPDGTVWAWGLNANGQLGDGTNVDKNAPIQVPGLTNVKSVACGTQFSLALKNDGTVWAWGANSSGQLGDGTTVAKSSPFQISTLNNIISIQTGTANGYALKSDGTVWAWGSNTSLQIGDGTNTNRPTPIQVFSGAIKISTNSNHVLALKSDGTVWAWGSNLQGRLGDGTTTNRGVPTQISISGVIDIHAYSHSAAIKSDGTVWAWWRRIYVDCY